MWKDTDIAYFAGIMDGEGSIYIQRRLHRGSTDYFPRFQVGNTDLVLMTWIKETFGGTLYEKRRLSAPEHWKAQYEWFSTRPLLDVLLPLITPYLKTKRRQAEIMMEFRDPPSRYDITIFQRPYLPRD
jgi:hypothetical protein